MGGCIELDGGVALEILIACGVPTAITGLFVWLLKKHIDKKDDARAERDRAREEFELMLVKGNNAAIALGEATAKAVQNIPDAHCNGDMHDALDYAQRVKHEQKDFLSEQGIKHIIY